MQVKYLVVEITQTPFPSVSALKQTPPLLLQPCEQTELAFSLGIDVLSARKFHKNLETSSAYSG
jgi:FAD synthase